MTASEWISTHWWEVMTAVWPLVVFLVASAFGVAAWATTIVIYLRRISEDGRATRVLVMHHKHAPIDPDTGEGGDVVFDKAAFQTGADLDFSKLGH